MTSDRKWSIRKRVPTGNVVQEMMFPAVNDIIHVALKETAWLPDPTCSLQHTVIVYCCIPALEHVATNKRG